MLNIFRRASAHISAQLGLIGLLVLSAGRAYAEDIQNISVDQLGKRYQLVGKLYTPIGTVVTVQGFVQEGPSKGYEGGPNLRIQRINGQATEEDIQIRLQAYFSDWGEKGESGGHGLPELELGKTYEMEGYETGGYVGTPDDAYRRAGVLGQNPGFYFVEDFVAYKAKRIEPITFGPSDFEGRSALLQGTAISENKTAILKSSGWKVVVDPKSAWPSDIEGKLIEADGTYKATEDKNKFTLEKGKWRLVRLEDQVGRKVDLRGIAKCSDVWYFTYRGENIYVEYMEELTGWSMSHDWRPVIIRGVLAKDKLRSLDWRHGKREITDCYIVRDASWEPLDALLSVERPYTDEAY